MPHLEKYLSNAEPEIIYIFIDIHIFTVQCVCISHVCVCVRAYLRIEGSLGGGGAAGGSAGHMVPVVERRATAAAAHQADGAHDGFATGNTCTHKNHQVHLFIQIPARYHMSLDYSLKAFPHTHTNKVIFKYMQKNPDFSLHILFM